MKQKKTSLLIRRPPRPRSSKWKHVSFGAEDKDVFDYIAKQAKLMDRSQNWLIRDMLRKAKTLMEAQA
jgi:hypothetical protein